MATREETNRASDEDDAFRRRIQMTQEARNPPLVFDSGDTKNFVNRMTEEQMAASKTLLTPDLSK